MSSASNNPGNFANRPTEEVREIASKGGKAAQELRHQKQLDELPGHGNPGNFANRPREEVREIAAMGGRASHGGHGNTVHKEDLPGHGNPGNFANRPKEEVREIASMGGLASGGFANMDPEKHVSAPICPCALSGDVNNGTERGCS